MSHFYLQLLLLVLVAHSEVTMKKLFFRTFLILINASCISNLYAAEVYKRVPFSVKITHEDTLIAEYDLSENRGMDCDSSSSDILASFTYKGRDKTATLPLTLQNYRVPTKKGEELSDTTGKVKMSVDKNKPAQAKEIIINCHYRS